MAFAYADIDLNFGLDNKGDLKMVYDNAALFQSIKNILETPTGFRPGKDNEYFGLSIKKYLFSPLDVSVAEYLADEVQRQLEQYDGRLVLEQINVNIDLETRSYAVDIYYKADHAQQVQTFNLVLKVR